MNANMNKPYSSPRIFNTHIDRNVTENTSLAFVKKGEAVDLRKSDFWLLQDSKLQMKVCATCHKILTNKPI